MYDSTVDKMSECLLFLVLTIIMLCKASPFFVFPTVDTISLLLYIEPDNAILYGLALALLYLRTLPSSNVCNLQRNITREIGRPMM